MLLGPDEAFMRYSDKNGPVNPAKQSIRKTARGKNPKSQAKSTRMPYRQLA